MYKQYDDLTPEELESLVELSKEVKFKNSEGSRMRVGQNGPKAMSIYNYSKWFDWKHKQREVFKACFPEVAYPMIVQGWFLDIPANTGFLDRMIQWVDYPMSGRIIATALKTQTIFLDDKPVRVKQGEQIGFSLCTVHEIKSSEEGQLWACTLFRGCHTEVHG